MVFIRAEIITQRLTYILNLICYEILGVDYKVVSFSENLNPTLHYIIDYSDHPLPDVLVIPRAGLLEETEIKAQKFEIKSDKVPYLFHIPTSLSNHLDFDVFSAAFYWVTEYEKWQNPLFDFHNRYDEKQYLVFQTKGYLYPLVHLYALALWDKLKSHYPHLERKRTNYRYQLTFDIDHPWKYRYKSPYIQYGGLLKNVLKGKWEIVQEAITALNSKKDPHDVFDDICNACSPSDTTFFFLIDRHSPYDSRFTLRHRPYQALIKKIFDRGYRVGIHPSYTSFMDAERLTHEVAQLSQFTGIPITHSRQHFLRYRLPDTFRILLKAGITDDYSLCNYYTGGFRTGMAQPYYWFDLENNCRTSLILHPTILMDTTLRFYLQLSHQEAVAYAQNLIDEVYAVNGEFTLLLHNDSWSESGMWKGWRSTIHDIIDSVKWR